jgi:hypothetical protein
MIQQPPFMIVSRLGGSACIASAAVLVASGRPVGSRRSVVPTGEIAAPVRAESARSAVLLRAHGASAVLARRIDGPAPVPCAVIAVGVAAPARRHQVLRRVVGRVAVEMISAQRRPGQRAVAPVARFSGAAELLKENGPADQNLAVLGRKGMSRQVAGWSRVRHATYLSQPWRTTDPAERARAMQVPKPPPVPDGQASLFDFTEAAI